MEKISGEGTHMLESKNQKYKNEMKVKNSGEGERRIPTWAQTHTEPGVKHTQ